jgi:hypothetical protein
MKRQLAQWVIGRALDLGKPIPRRIREWIQQDPELQKFEQQAGRLQRRLIQGADDWFLNASQSSVRPLSPHSGNLGSASSVRSTDDRSAVVTWGQTCGMVLVAGCLLFMLFMLFGPAREPGPAHRTPVVSWEQRSVRAISKQDQQTLVEVLHAGQALALPMSRNIERLRLPSPMVSASEPLHKMAQQMLAMRHLNAFWSPVWIEEFFPALRPTPIRGLCSSLGAQLHVERQGLEADIKLGASFVLSELPRSVLRLLGFQT